VQDLKYLNEQDQKDAKTLTH
jgi:hypothetical protein